MAKPLFIRVTTFLRQSHMADTTFGRESSGDPHFVKRMRKGADFRPETIAKVEAYLDQRGG